MCRQQEITIIIEFLVKQVETDVISENPYLVDRIINNGKLIEVYRQELNELIITA